MLNRILHWVYCLPLERAAVLALLATGVFFWCHHRWKKKLWWKVTVGVLIACWAVVALAVVILRDYGVQQVSLIPFRSYFNAIRYENREPIRNCFMNALLFYPGGLLLGSLFPKKKRKWVLLSFLLLSVAVEAAQYLLAVGVTETDDVLHNTLGAALGWLALHQYEKHNADGP